MKSVFVNTMEVNGVQMLGFLNHIDLHCMDLKKIIPQKKFIQVWNDMRTLENYNRIKNYR